MHVAPTTEASLHPVILQRVELLRRVVPGRRSAALVWTEGTGRAAWTGAGSRYDKPTTNVTAR